MFYLLSIYSGNVMKIKMFTTYASEPKKFATCMNVNVGTLSFLLKMMENFVAFPLS